MTLEQALHYIHAVCWKGSIPGLERINALLHEYSNALVGRMGMPYRARNAHIINVTVDAPEREIREFTARLGRLPATSVKVTYAPEDGERTGESL